MLHFCFSTKIRANNPFRKTAILSLSGCSQSRVFRISMPFFACPADEYFRALQNIPFVFVHYDELFPRLFCITNIVFVRTI